jgi:hypothetical protein
VGGIASVQVLILRLSEELSAQHGPYRWAGMSWESRGAPGEIPNVGLRSSHPKRRELRRPDPKTFKSPAIPPGKEQKQHAYFYMCNAWPKSLS